MRHGHVVAAAVVRRLRGCARGDESGQILVLTVGFAVLCLLVATTVMGVSAVHIEHKKLLSAADGAAAAAADSFTLADTASGEAPPAALLSEDRVRGVVATYLERAGAGARFERLAVASATGTPDGRTATVSLTAFARVPLVSIVLPDGVPIQATASARARLVR
ncbi:pilus assembly protein TadG-related protein [Sinomonas mesophila]|uniref:pilus assembly protein TadG-related protein n=1 Tax=Sinomonas mesophila TaxID=1531955 RepID=UPI001FE982B0|nr:pilus assembly protein TadG-related protein [Sinomonas mesophila]